MQRFSTHGYVGTSMDMVVSDVGGSKATLYRYFPTKDALVAGLIERVGETVGADMIDPTSSTAPLEDELVAIGQAACHGVWSQSAVAVLRLCLGEFNRFPELAETVWEAGPARTYANFRAFIAERQRRGEIAVDDPQIAAEQFIGGLVGHQQLKVAFGMGETPTQAGVDARVAHAVRWFMLQYRASDTTEQPPAPAPSPPARVD